jgi:hypothetical protein
VPGELLEGGHHGRGLAPARVISCGFPAGRGGAQDERRDPFRASGREQQAHRRTLGVAEEHRTAGAARVHHRLQVGQLFLERRVPWPAIGQAGVALVEQDRAAQRREPAKEARGERLLPPQIQVTDQARYEHDVRLSRAGDLVGDVQVPVDRIPRLGRAKAGDGVGAAPVRATDPGAG